MAANIDPLENFRLLVKEIIVDELTPESLNALHWCLQLPRKLLDDVIPSMAILRYLEEREIIFEWSKKPEALIRLLTKNLQREDLAAKVWEWSDPLFKNPAHPKVIFDDKTTWKQFTSSGGYADFNNGVEVTVPASAVSAGATGLISVQSSLAPRGAFVLPEGFVSASPSYLISGEGVSGEVTLDMEHHVQVCSLEETEDLSFLEVDSSSTISGSGNKPVYQYEEVPKDRAEFTPGKNKGRLRLVVTRKKYVKTGRKKKGFNLPDLYTVRVYRSPPHTRDKIALIIVCYLQRVFLNLLDNFERVVIPQEHPQLSNRPDKTIKQPLCFERDEVTLKLDCHPSWRSVVDQEKILRDEVDLPVSGLFLPEELSSCYPPKIVCQFFPEQRAVFTTCTLSLHGFNKAVSVNMALFTTPQRTVDLHQLKEASEGLRRTVTEMTSSQLSSSVESVLSLVEKITIALQSSSLNELTGHTESIQTEIMSILGVTRRIITEECAIEIQSASSNIEASLSEITTLSHQLCHVARVRLHYYQDQSEETAALVDLVESGANLLRTVDSLLKDVQRLTEIGLSNTGYSVLMNCSEKIVQSLSEEPKAIALGLLSAGLITECILEKTNELNETKREKATRLYTALLGVVKQDPQKYHEFVSTLRLHSLYTDLVTALDTHYN